MDFDIICFSNPGPMCAETKWLSDFLHKGQQSGYYHHSCSSSYDQVLLCDIVIYFQFVM